MSMTKIGHRAGNTCYKAVELLNLHSARRCCHWPGSVGILWQAPGPAGLELLWLTSDLYPDAINRGKVGLSIRSMPAERRRSSAGSHERSRADSPAGVGGKCLDQDRR